jgi:cytochrome o ubiquinol oxidase subunit II
MKKSHAALLVAIVLSLGAFLVWHVRNNGLVVLQPKGQIAEKQAELIILSLLLMALVVVPVWAMTFFIAWRYRESNVRAKYQPDWDHDKKIETVWWGIPLLLITVLSVLSWKGSHQLDPFRQLDSDSEPLTVQVIALQWKWLFIYPTQNIATVNFVQIPVQTPIKFEITSDAPMNSFWIPSLGGQIYAMSGMKTELNLVADELGTFQGSSANISGSGFSDMNFKVASVWQTDFSNWVDELKKSGNYLLIEDYEQLARPSRDHSLQTFSAFEPGVFEHAINKYILPRSGQTANDQAARPGGSILNYYHPGSSR